MQNKMHYLVLILCLLFCSDVLFADGFASPIGPGKKEKENYLGIVLGFGQNIQNGTSLVNCEHCQFTDGLGFGYTFGLVYERQIALTEDNTFWANMYYGAMFNLSNANVSSSYRELTNHNFEEYDIWFPVLYRQTNEISLMSVGVMPYISYTPMKYLFGRLGFNINYFFRNNTRHTTELLDRRTTLPNGEVVNIYVPAANNPNRRLYSMLLQDSEIADINKLQLGITPSLGSNIYFSNNFIFSPSFSYYIPFSKLVQDSGLSISTWRLNLEFKYNMVSTERIYKGKQKPKQPIRRTNTR
ncbi:MAG: hypothetical protein FWG85_01365 [Bacteroidetes bacterium]|nr:hypothetical protein [Bacteroidota bacterium]